MGETDDGVWEYIYLEEYWALYRTVVSLYCMLLTNITVSVDYTGIKIKKFKNNKN